MPDRALPLPGRGPEKLQHDLGSRGPEKLQHNQTGFTCRSLSRPGAFLQGRKRAETALPLTPVMAKSHHIPSR